MFTFKIWKSCVFAYYSLLYHNKSIRMTRRCYRTTSSGVLHRLTIFVIRRIQSWQFAVNSLLYDRHCLPHGILVCWIHPYLRVWIISCYHCIFGINCEKSQTQLYSWENGDWGWIRSTPKDSCFALFIFRIHPAPSLKNWTYLVLVPLQSVVIMILSVKGCSINGGKIIPLLDRELLFVQFRGNPNSLFTKFSSSVIIKTILVPPYILWPTVQLRTGYRVCWNKERDRIIE